MVNALGKLFLIGTPIGNPEDLSFRAAKVISQVDFLFCEDTRRTAILLKTHDIETKNPLESFHDHSSRSKLVRVIQLLKAGNDVGYVTDGGLPVVSDPGYVLVRAAHEQDILVTLIPGPTAASSLFALSGLGSPKMFFHGFFPRTKGEVEKVLGLVQTLPVVHVFYESPVRVVAALEILQRHYPLAQVVLGRELTKTHEQLVRGSAKFVWEEVSSWPKVRGECVFGVHLMPPKEAYQQQLESQPVVDVTAPNSRKTIENVLSDTLRNEIVELMKQGEASKDIAKAIAKKTGIPRRVIYEFIIRHLT
jgi:16S rRNA (cytidine1402-2'-O)-methyltransferase